MYTIKTKICQNFPSWSFFNYFVTCEIGKLSTKFNKTYILTVIKEIGGGVGVLDRKFDIIIQK